MPDDRNDVRWGRTGAYDPRGLAPWVLLLVLVAAAAVGSALAPKARAQAPGFTLETTGAEGGAWVGPRAVTLEQYRGRVVVLDLMAVRCAPCREVTERTLQPIWAEHGARSDFALLSIDAWADPAYPAFAPGLETGDALLRLQNETGAPWPHALDSDGVWRKYGVQSDGLPKVVVVDRWGRVAGSWSGDVDPEAVRDVVAAELA